MSGSGPNYLGQKIGRVTVLEKLPQRGASRSSRWRCLCDCGKEVEKMGMNLSKAIRQGQQNVSCGCYQKERAKEVHTTHGHAKGRQQSPEYSSYRAMRDRCFNPNNPEYPNYGGRGITVCDRWLGEHGFQNFLEDMGERPSLDETLDRIGYNGNYEPSNCRWADKTTQVLNRRNAHGMTYTGVHITWRGMKAKGNCVEAFKDFRFFLQAMGERPENCVLWRHNLNEPHSPENSYWQERSEEWFQTVGKSNVN